MSLSGLLHRLLAKRARKNTGSFSYPPRGGWLGRWRAARAERRPSRVTRSAVEVRRDR
jgi:hypothetical protein